MQERMVRPIEFMQMLGVRTTKFYEMKKVGKFPEPVRIGGNRIAWPLSQVNQVIEDLKNGRVMY